MSEKTTNHSTCELRGNVLVVTVQVENLRNHETSYALRDEMIAAMDATKATHLVIDLSLVTFVSSVGLLGFLGVRRHVLYGRIVICGMSKNVQKIFEVCRLLTTESTTHSPFEAAPNVEAAIAQIAA